MEPLRHRRAENRRRPAPEFGPLNRDASNVEENEDAGTVQVIWGATIDDLDIADMTVGDAYWLLRQAYNIAPEATANVNGVEAGADTRLACGDVLEFVRAAGEKGVA